MISSTRPHKRGSLLGTVLLSITFFALMLFLMGGLAQKDLLMVSASGREMDADYAGRSVVALAYDALQQGDVMMSERIDYVPEAGSFVDAGNAPPTAYIHFDKEKEMYSTNNLNSGKAVFGWRDRLVPKRCIHLVGIGRAGNLGVSQDVVIGMRDFPYSVASNGTIEGTHLDIFGLESMEALADGVTEEEKKKAQVVSNHAPTSAKPVSVTFGEGTSVKGDVAALGEIVTENPDAFDGKRILLDEPKTLISLDISTYDPQAAGQTFAPYNESLAKITDGRARHDGDLNLSDLTLERGVLFVDGDLTITGHVKGEGAVICTGNLMVTGQLNLESDFLAVLADGDVKIDGRGTEDLDTAAGGGTRVQGLVYSNGSFTANDATLVGAVVSAKIDGVTKLERVNFGHVPEAASFEITVSAGLEAVIVEGLAKLAGYDIGVELPDGTVTFFDELHESELQALSQFLAQQPADERGEVKIYQNGVEMDSASLNIGVRKDFSDKVEACDNYIIAIENNTATTETIFSIDLNSFLSIEDNLKVLWWTSVRRFE